MIFGRVCVICDDFGDYHDEIVVTSIDFIGSGQFVAIICKGRGHSGSPLRKQRLWVIDLIVGGHEEEIKF